MSPNGVQTSHVCFFVSVSNKNNSYASKELNIMHTADALSAALPIHGNVQCWDALLSSSTFAAVSMKQTIPTT